MLCSLLDTETTVLLGGYVSKRRAIGKSLVFLDIVPTPLPSLDTYKKKSIVAQDESVVPVQAILRRDFWVDYDKYNSTTFDVFQKIIQPGIHVELIGRAGPSRIPNESMLLVSRCVYKLANSNPQHLRNVLQFAKDGVLDVNEVLEALPCVDDLDLEDQSTTMGELAVALLDQFPRNFLLSPSRLMGTTNAAKIALLPPVPTEYKSVPAFDIDISDSSEIIPTISSALKLLKQSKKDTANQAPHRQFTFSSWVQNRRRFQDGISVVELVDDFSSVALSVDNDSDDLESRNRKLNEAWKERIYAVLHPDSMGSIEAVESYGNLLCSGARVMVQGCIETSNEHEVPILWVTKCRLLRSTWRPSVVRTLLDLLHAGKLDIQEAADALELPGGYAQAEAVAEGETSGTERQWMAAEITQTLQSENSRTGKVTDSMIESLDAFESAREAYPIEVVKFASTSGGSFEYGTAATILDMNSNRASPERSRWSRAKKPQLMWMIDQISTVLTSHPEYGQRKLKVVDIGGGKGLLSNLLAETFGEKIVDVNVVDISKSAINNGMMRAKRRGLGNIRYDAQDATTLDVAGVDVVVALHACGTLSDVALGHAVNQGAGFVICPCCFRSNPHLRVPMPASREKGIQLVTAEEWLDTTTGLYEPLKQLAEMQGDMNLSSKAMHTICGLRATAVDRLWRDKTSMVSTSIKSFPIGFSTRNLCLVGKFDSIQDRGGIS